MGNFTNAPFAANSPLFFDGDSRSQEGVIFDDFPRGRESFLTFRPFPPPIFLFGPSTQTISPAAICVGAGSYSSAEYFLQGRESNQVQ